MSNEPKTQDATLDDLARENQEISDRLKALPHVSFTDGAYEGFYQTATHAPIGIVTGGTVRAARDVGLVVDEGLIIAGNGCLPEPTYTPTFTIPVGDGVLTVNLQTGEVEAPSLEAASEAGRVFVESVRGYLTKPEGSRYANLTVAELEAEQAAIDCALEAARKAEAA